MSQLLSLLSTLSAEDFMQENELLILLLKKIIKQVPSEELSQSHLWKKLLSQPPNVHPTLFYLLLQRLWLQLQLSQQALPTLSLTSLSASSSSALSAPLSSSLSALSSSLASSSLSSLSSSLSTSKPLPSFPMPTSSSSSSSSTSSPTSLHQFLVNQTSRKPGSKKPITSDDEPEKKPSKRRKASSIDEDPPEKRLKRSLTERLYLINREQVSPFEMKFAVLGSPGNVYHVSISLLPKCDCSEPTKEGFCKHITFVLCRVLKVDSNSPILQQQALQKLEVQQIFSNAPPDPAAAVKANLAVQRAYMTLSGKGVESKTEPKRKTIKEVDECSICCEVFGEKEQTVWCEAQCGYSFHQDCFSQWALLARKSGQEITCPLCRIPWLENKHQDKPPSPTKRPLASLLESAKYNSALSEPEQDSNSFYDQGKKRGKNGKSSRDY